MKPETPQTDWVECCQFLHFCKSWNGDARDLCRLLQNLKDPPCHMTPEQVIDLQSRIRWNRDDKKTSWTRVYVRFKKIYHQSTGR